MQTNNIIELFMDSALKNADRQAFVHDTESVTYKELLVLVQRQAGYYRNKDIGKGSKVLVLAPMSISLYKAVLALLYIGACPVFLDEWVSTERLKRCCDTVRCDAMITTGKLFLFSFFIRQLRQIPGKVRLNAQGGHTADVSVAAVEKEDTALITFTTGTTGIPKAADRTHAFLKAQYDVLLPLLDNGAATSLTMLPIVVLINLGMGKTIVLPPSKFVAANKETVSFITRSIVKNRVEEIIASPAILQNICHDIGETESNVSSVRYLLTGGGPVFPALAVLALDTFRAANGKVVFGSTEAEPVSHISLNEVAGCSLDDLQANGLSVGQPDDAVSIAIIPYKEEPWENMNITTFQELHMQEGVVGEIVVTGRHVLKEYINNPVAGQRHKIKVDAAIWHRTGDAGTLVNGKLSFLGPCKEAILHNGVTYYPVISCYVFSQLTGAQAALLALNGILMLVVEAIKPIEPDILVGALQKTSLVDASIIYISSIPRDPRHQTKVDYDELRKQLKTGLNIKNIYKCG